VKRAEKAERIAKILDRLYPEPPIPLAHEDPFTLLVSVVLSAQCTDARVNQVTPALFAAAPTPAELEALPGVGHKTASVVMVQAFGEAAFPVDTHIHRLAARWGLSTGRNVVQTERDLKKLFPEKDWGRVHLQMIYFGREHCPALRHDLGSCAICSWAAPKRRRGRGAPPAGRNRGIPYPPPEPGSAGRNG